MADINKRLHYFNGQFLEEKDFTDEQEYHLDRDRRHNRLLHTYGVAEGLNVTAAAGSGDVTVAPGTALDGLGRLIVLEQSRTLTLGSLSKAIVYVVISYDEIGVDPATVGNQGQPTRWEERPKVELVASAGAPPADTHIRLAKISVSAGGTVSSVDLAERQRAGVQVGNELAIPRLRLSNPNFDESRWPSLTADKEEEVTLTGDLTITGRLTTPEFSAHLRDNANPHVVTAAQTGALVSVGGVSNAGGNVNIVAGTGLSVASDNSNNKRITISGSSILGVSNPGGDIGMIGTNGINITSDNSSNKRITVAGATIQGVSNPGGDIGIVGASGITIASDNSTGNKRITITGGAPTNIGGITAPGATVNIVGGANITVTADNTSNKRLTIAASPAFTNHTVVNTIFSAADANGSTRTITTGFMPRFVWFSCNIQGTVASSTHGGVGSGFADLESSPIAQFGSGPNITRVAAAPTIVVNSTVVNNLCARGLFSDTTVSPNLQVDMSVAVASVAANGFTLQFTKSSSTGTFPSAYSITLYMACMA
jgi:hypothetical protein